MTGKSYEEMSGPELVSEYNRLTGGNVKRFATRAAALKRVTEAAAKVKPNGSAATKERKNLVTEFRAREGSNRHKLILALKANVNKTVPVSELLKATYGARTNEKKSALMMVMKGVQVMIDKEKLNYKIVREKTTEGIQYGIFDSTA